jgi:FKBP-type peptidyl-prolyl cis-trans isomerase (trigger factor)
VGEGSISVSEFRQSEEAAAEEAFPGEHNIEISVREEMRMRVLNQLTEELLIAEKARTLGIQVSEEEINLSIEAIKADYPDNTFEETLLENAVSFDIWKQKLIRRLLIDKVIQQELVDNVKITSSDVSEYVKKHFPQGPPEKEDMNGFNQRVVHHLRQQKAEQAYKEWLDKLRVEFPVEVNREQWRLLKEES